MEKYIVIPCCLIALCCAVYILLPVMLLMGIGIAVYCNPFSNRFGRKYYWK